MRPEFTIRSDSVDVEQIMKQIRSRVREKRGVDYTEEEIRELAKVKLEQFLDPARLRSDLLEHYRARRPGPVPPGAPVHLPPVVDIQPPHDVPSEPEPENYDFDPNTPYESSRGLAGRLLVGLRRILNPLLKLFINPNPILHVITLQSAFNARTAARFSQLVEHANRSNERIAEMVHQLRVLNLEGLVPLQNGLQEGLQDGSHQENTRRNIDALNYEVAHNLVLEMTRLGIEVKNMKMRVESIASRLDFTDRRLRALEGVVQYRAGTGPAAEGVRSVAPSQPQVPAPSLAPARTAARPPAQPQTQPQTQPRAAVEAETQPGAPIKGDAQRARRRRRRRSRGGQGQAPGQAGGAQTAAARPDSPREGDGGPQESHSKVGDATSPEAIEAEDRTPTAAAGPGGEASTESPRSEGQASTEATGSEGPTSTGSSDDSEWTP